MLERGRDVKHGDYPTATKDIWEFPYGGRATDEDLKRQAVAARSGYAITQASKHWFVDDTEHPYTEIKRFDWIRGYHVGGRSIMWGRQSYRWSDLDFEANAQGRRRRRLADPLRRDRAVVRPRRELHRRERPRRRPAAAARRQVPAADGAELRRDSSASRRWPRSSSASMTIGRVAHLTAPLAHSPQRGTCQYRNLCIRGCPYGAYFSSNSSTLPAAEATGNMTLRPNSIVVRADLRRQQAARDRRARARRGDQRAPGVHCQGDLPVRLDVRLDASSC